MRTYPNIALNAVGSVSSILIFRLFISRILAEDTSAPSNISFDRVSWNRGSANAKLKNRSFTSVGTLEGWQYPSLNSDFGLGCEPRSYKILNDTFDAENGHGG